MKRLLLLLFCLILFTTQAVTAVSPPGPLVYFTNNATAIGTSPDPTVMEQALLDSLNNASSTVDLAIYDFNRDSIRDALLAAKQRGVTVRVVSDDEARHFNETYLPYYDALAAAGIPIVDDERENSIMHNKYFIIDSRYVWTGSTNMTNNGFTLNHNNGLLFDDSGLAALYQADFNQMFENGNFSVTKTPATTTSHTYNGIPLELYFSPEDGGMAALIDEVNNATSSIEFSIFFFTDDALRDALIARAEAGVKIRGLWDQLGGSSPFSDDAALCAAGIPIKLEDFTGKMHNKYMVLDANTANGRVVTGSMNWTSSGDGSNDENTLIIHDPATAQAYNQAFWQLYNALSPETECDIGTKDIYLPLILRDRLQPVPFVLLDTIVYNPDGDDLAGEYVLIRNRGNAEQVMTSWGLTDESNNTFIFPEFTLPAAGEVRVWVTSGTDTATDLFWGRGSAVWNNGGDSAILTDANGDLVDICSYEGGGSEAICNGQ